MTQHITKLDEEYLLTSKKNEIRQKSKMRNKEFRSAAQRLAMAASASEAGLQKVTYPPQSKGNVGLFFRGEPTSPKRESIIPLETKQVVQDKTKGQDFKVVKEEIETRMDELNEDLRRIDDAHTGSLKQLRRGSLFGERLNRHCDLAKSAQHFAEHQSERPKKLTVKVDPQAVHELTSLVDRKRLALLNVPTKKKTPMVWDLEAFLGTSK